MPKLRYILYSALIMVLAACGRGDAAINPRPTAPTTPPTAAPEAEAVADTSPSDPVAAALATGDPAAGQTAFQMQHSLPDGSAWACMACHSVGVEENVLIGPPLYNLTERAATRIEGEDAVIYIHNSIANPSAFIAPVPEGAPVQQWALQMPAGFGEVLSEQDLNNVIAYILTLHD